ncbi:MAG TPA: glycosyltransferase [Solirubrobacteraceae bacterium]|nr:glycosyltransferase [Solirubrobacteraceae bacterium]
MVAARNEADRIAATLAALARAFPGTPIWVADDGSSDATAELARAGGAHVVSSARALGKGAAVTRAAREALRDPSVVGEALRDHSVAGAALENPRVAGAGRDGHSIEPHAELIFVLCDGDLGDSAALLGALADTIARGDADVAIAAFATRVGGGFGLALGFARWAIRRSTGVQISAPISGQRALRRSVLEDVLPFAHGFGMEIGMTIDALRAGHRLVEVELELEHRASARTPAGFLHRGRQLVHFVRAYLARR